MSHLDKYPFLKDCSVLQLAALQKEARDIDDAKLRHAVLIELAVRDGKSLMSIKDMHD